jgi:hypothetical protein
MAACAAHLQMIDEVSGFIAVSRWFPSHDAEPRFPADPEKHIHP